MMFLVTFLGEMFLLPSNKINAILDLTVNHGHHVFFMRGITKIRLGNDFNNFRVSSVNDIHHHACYDLDEIGPT